MRPWCYDGLMTYDVHFSAFNGTNYCALTVSSTIDPDARRFNWRREEGREITALHRRWLTITGNRYAPARHRGIAELYVMDERFTAYYDKRLPGCARFLRDAVVHWVK